ncbi:MAG: hypothetical protein ACE37L_14620 [Allomuricauda sp.]
MDNEITNNAADGTETIVTGAGINVVTGDGSLEPPRHHSNEAQT